MAGAGIKGTPRDGQHQVERTQPPAPGSPNAQVLDEISITKIIAIYENIKYIKLPQSI